MKGLITFRYSKIIDRGSSKTKWDQYVFDDTYREFFMQAQEFDQEGNYSTFHEILANVPKAEEMHYLVSTAAVSYIRQLNNYIPNVLNTAGKTCLPFKNFRFEILQSHTRDKNQHRIAIHFFSEEIIWIDSLGKHLIFALGDQLGLLKSGLKVETDTLIMPSDLGICSFREFKIANTNR